MMIVNKYPNGLCKEMPTINFITPKNKMETIRQNVNLEIFSLKYINMTVEV